jgi:DNA-binding NarL/FixJ family response regulator
MELNRVLIVDDDPAIRRVVCALLDLDEYGLLEAADGQAALEVVSDELPDLVILDLTCPGWTGSGPAPPATPGRTPTWSSRSRPWPARRRQALTDG